MIDLTEIWNFFLEKKQELEQSQWGFEIAIAIILYVLSSIGNGVLQLIRKHGFFSGFSFFTKKIYSISKWLILKVRWMLIRTAQYLLKPVIMPMIENSIQEHTQAESKKEQLLTKKEGQNTKSVSTPAWQEDSKSIALLSKKHSFELHQAVFNLDSYDVKIDIRQIQGGNWRLYFKFSTEKIFPSDILLSSPYPLYTISTASRHKAKMLSLSYKNLKIEEKFDIDEFYDNGAFNVKIGYSFNGEEIVFDIFYPDGELMESHSITSSKFNYFKMILIGVDENVRMIYSVEKIERTIVLPF